MIFATHGSVHISDCGISAQLLHLIVLSPRRSVIEPCSVPAIWTRSPYEHGIIFYYHCFGFFPLRLVLLLFEGNPHDRPNMRLCVSHVPADVQCNYVQFHTDQNDCGLLGYEKCHFMKIEAAGSAETLETTYYKNSQCHNPGRHRECNTHRHENQISLDSDITVAGSNSALQS